MSYFARSFVRAAQQASRSSFGHGPAFSRMASAGSNHATMRSAIPAAMRASGGGAFRASRPAMSSFSSSPPMSYGFAASGSTSPTSSSGSGSSGLSGGGSTGDGVAADGAEGAVSSASSTGTGKNSRRKKLSGC
ncbi:hypothetical protein DUNSADRAFT_16645 [Dunaliella salina]|uniref:Encoded protein n=1 Tax=Dunaliella salina TaxID=3046 RepID=A0ABQ7G357_DUNSA|nr:hypothetical protein DUNSADRAFT_16645 [Dunaliella salina]|eukprot:KAF5829041.1 hypothetical protein DUNSADRAFT_16645 [Dunaliella salina]